LPWLHKYSLIHINYKWIIKLGILFKCLWIIREASHARPGKERETLRCFHAHAINSRHLPTSPLSHCLSSLFLPVVSLPSPKLADGSTPAAKNCIEGGGRASSPLLRRLSRYIDCLASSSASKHLGFKPDFNHRCSEMSVSPQITLNPHLLLSIYLFRARRRTLVDMHSGSARHRVQSD
jgi:hypothetical protein